MADLSLEWNGDLVLTADQDLALADGADETRQRIIRRLLTAVNGYLWHLGYGLGLPQRIGKPAKASIIQALCRAQIAQEQSVARVPLPQVTVTEVTSSAGLFLIAIRYTDAVTGRALSLSLEIPGTR